MRRVVQGQQLADLVDPVFEFGAVEVGLRQVALDFVEDLEVDVVDVLVTVVDVLALVAGVVVDEETHFVVETAVGVDQHLTLFDAVQVLALGVDAVPQVFDQFLGLLVAWRLFLPLLEADVGTNVEIVILEELHLSLEHGGLLEVFAGEQGLGAD